MKTIKRIFQSFLRGPIYILFLGLIFFAIGGGLMIQQVSFKQHAAQAQGVVTELSMNCDDEGCSYSPIVRFFTRDGNAHFYTSSYASNPPAYDTGESVTILYSPENPRKAMILGEGRGLQVVFMGIGGVVILFGFIFFSSNLKNSFLSEE